MRKEAYDQLYQAEDVHWYHDGRRKLVETYLKCIRNEIGCQLEILDVGSGTGGMFGLLKKYGKVTGLELSDYAIELSRKKHPHATIIAGSANNLSELFPKSSFDLVTFFNVLYHKWIEDDRAVLKQAADIIRPGGYVILNEPAFMCLYRNFDRFAYAIRRYTQSEIDNMLSASGLSLVKSTYFNSISFVPLFMSALLEHLGFIKLRDVSNELRLFPRPINACFKYAMSIERMCINIFGRMPFGVSLLSIGKKV